MNLLQLELFTEKVDPFIISKIIFKAFRKAQNWIIWMGGEKLLLLWLT